LYRTAADIESATGCTIATKKTARDVAVVVTKTTKRTTEERRPGAHLTSMDTLEMRKANNR
jgi:hypothetical protein